ncbi:MAG: hypothetical protein HY077_00215 [Elusimicrobia bacterium]|nr:hypothetical protein [Elusimicrobiota bacterium]
MTKQTVSMVLSLLLCAAPVFNAVGENSGQLDPQAYAHKDNIPPDDLDSLKTKGYRSDADGLFPYDGTCCLRNRDVWTLLRGKPSGEDQPSREQARSGKPEPIVAPDMAGRLQNGIQNGVRDWGNGGDKGDALITGSVAAVPDVRGVAPARRALLRVAHANNASPSSVQPWEVHLAPYKQAPVASADTAPPTMPAKPPVIKDARTAPATARHSATGQAQNSSTKGEVATPDATVVDHSKQDLKGGETLKTYNKQLDDFFQDSAQTSPASTLNHDTGVQSGGYSPVGSFGLAEGYVNDQLQKFISELLRQSVSLMGWKLDIKLKFKENHDVMVDIDMSIPPGFFGMPSTDKDLLTYHITSKMEVLSTPHQGYLIFKLPPNGTLFKRANSDIPPVAIHTELLSDAVAIARGYLAALSGDMAGFDAAAALLQKQMAALKLQMDQLNKERDRKEYMKLQAQFRLFELQKEATEIQRGQFKDIAEQVHTQMFSFVGDKELNLNNLLAARGNSLVLKVNLEQITPPNIYKLVAGIRLKNIQVEDRDGHKELYFYLEGPKAKKKV